MKYEDLSSYDVEVSLINHLSSHVFITAVLLLRLLPILGHAKWRPDARLRYEIPSQGIH